MCQINTDPMMFQTATLDVNVPPDIGLRNMVLAKESPLHTVTESADFGSIPLL